MRDTIKVIFKRLSTVSAYGGYSFFSKDVRTTRSNFFSRACESMVLYTSSSAPV